MTGSDLVFGVHRGQCERPVGASEAPQRRMQERQRERGERWGRKLALVNTTRSTPRYQSIRWKKPACMQRELRSCGGSLKLRLLRSRRSKGRKQKRLKRIELSTPLQRRAVSCARSRTGERDVFCTPPCRRLDVTRKKAVK